MLNDEEIKNITDIPEEEKQEALIKKSEFTSKALDSLKELAKEIDPMLMLFGMPILKAMEKKIFPNEEEEVTIIKARFKVLGVDALTDVAKETDPMIMLVGVPILSSFEKAFFKDVASVGVCN